MLNTTKILREIDFLFEEEITNEEVENYLQDNTHPDN